MRLDTGVYIIKLSKPKSKTISTGLHFIKYTTRVLRGPLIVRTKNSEKRHRMDKLSFRVTCKVRL